MSEAGAAELRARLAANAEAEARLVEQLRRMVEASEQSNADDEHDPEGSTIAFERQQVHALLDQLRRTREELQRAATDLTAGRWGTCERCGGPIGEQRLQARPQARTCIVCASKDDRRRR